VKFLVDANLSPTIARRLDEAGHDAIHVIDLGLADASDLDLLLRAEEDDRVIISADADFGALISTHGRQSPSVILLRSADHLSPTQQAALLLANLPQLASELTTGAIASLGRGRLRIRTLPIHE
jgi:predicted nuclease of predicted toxin-antitoxin system